MNKIEATVYSMVRKNPALKQFVRNCYQSFFDLMPRKKDFFLGHIVFRENFFFGFHDISPLSEDGTKLLAMHSDFDLRMPLKGESSEVGYFDFINGDLGAFHKIESSFAWNYHKGCRLQWVDRDSLIFNSVNNGSLCSIMHNVATHEQSIISYPIDSVFVDKTKRIASSFSYERLERCMPGYGYPYSDNGFTDMAAPRETGIFIVDLDKDTRYLLLNLEEIALKVTGKIENEYLHFVTHSEFSKDGKYLSFLYRRIPKVGDYMKRRSVMCVYSFDERELIVLPSQESGSHYVWNNKNQLIASCNIDDKNCHVLFDMNDLSSIKIVDGVHLNSDGHQSFITDESFVTDTYPDKFRMAKLYVADIPSDSSKLIADIYSPKSFQTKDFHCHIACDLHPRVIGNGKYVCFDSPRTGKRGLYIMELPEK